MLTIVHSGSTVAAKRLNVAISHLEAAIVHINNEAQCQIPLEPGAGSRQTEDLSLIVRALSDVIEVLRLAGMSQAGEHEAAAECPPVTGYTELRVINQRS